MTTSALRASEAIASFLNVAPAVKDRGGIGKFNQFYSKSRQPIQARFCRYPLKSSIAGLSAIKGFPPASKTILATARTTSGWVVTHFPANGRRASLV
jgi:hypothetical protein